MVGPTRKDEVVQSASSAFEPSEDATSGMFEEFELDGPAGLLLYDDRSGTNPAATDKLADLDFYHVASAKFAVDREIEHRTVAQPTFLIQPKPDGPDLLRLERAFATKLPTRVPRPPILGARIVLG
jgi:hypothetical protein